MSIDIRTLPWATFALLGALPAQGGPPPRPLLEVYDRLPPTLALEHLALGNREFVDRRRAIQRRQDPGPMPARSRPAASGQHVVGLIADCDAPLEAREAFGLQRRDLLDCRVPGPVVETGTIARLERAVADDRLSLIVVLVSRTPSPHRPTRPESPSQRAHRSRLEPTAPYLRAANGDRFGAIALRQVGAILSASESLRRLERRGAIWIVAATLDPQSGRVHYFGKRARRCLERLPPPEVRVFQEHPANPSPDEHAGHHGKPRARHGATSQPGTSDSHHRATERHGKTGSHGTKPHH